MNAPTPPSFPLSPGGRNAFSAVALSRSGANAWKINAHVSTSINPLHLGEFRPAEVEIRAAGAILVSGDEEDYKGPRNHVCRLVLVGVLWLPEARDERRSNVTAQATFDEAFGRLAVVQGKPHSANVRLVGLAARQRGTHCADVLERFERAPVCGAILTVSAAWIRIGLRD